MATEDEESIEQASSLRRDRLRALRDAQDFLNTPEEGTPVQNENGAPDPAEDAEEKEEEQFERAAALPRERLMALRMENELLTTPDESAVDAEQSAEQKNLNLKFRNYLPHDEQLQGVKLPPAVLAKFEDPIAAAPLQPEKIEDPFVNIAPKKPNWDLQRDVQKRLEKLERRTQKTIYQIMRCGIPDPCVEEQEKEREALEGANGTPED